MSPRRRLMLFVAAAMALLLVGVIGVRAAGVGRTSAVPSSIDRSKPGTVLLVPGYGGGTVGLELLATKLRAAGRTAVVVPAVGDGTGDLLAEARSLQSAADKAVAAGAPSVDVVGYSAGGVVALLWAVSLHGERIARRVVTLGAPFHGTGVAELGAAVAPSLCPIACQQLVPGSSLLDSLPTAASISWVSLYTAQDQVVTPATSAVLAGAVSIELQKVCPDEVVTHGQLPTDPLVSGLVLTALGPAPLTAAPGPEQCQALRAASAG